MARPGLRNAVVFSTFAALVALLLRSLRSAPLPSSSTPNGGSAPSTTMAPASNNGDVAPATVAPIAEPAVVADPLPGLGPVDAPVAEETPEVTATGTTLPEWVEATDDDPPAAHPVKAKLASGIYHVPGGASYERTTPDRWYRSAEAAQADGLRPAKR